MTSPISDSSISHTFRQAPPPSTEQSAFKQTAAYEKSSSISMRTQEGDMVTISASSLAASKVSQESFGSIFAARMGFAATTTAAESFTISVSGNLNEEELRDIHRLFTDLTAIAEDFFAGDLAAALGGAASLGDMGSVRELQASFSRTGMISSQWRGDHPIPAGLVQTMPEEGLPAMRQASAQDDQLKAQWRQLEQYLEENAFPREQVGQTPKSPHPEAINSLDTLVSLMRDKMRETMAVHPRLSPFLVPVADKALATAEPADAPPARRRIIDELSDWMYNS